MQGFYPGCWNSEGLKELFEADLKSMPAYNLSKMYAVHLFEKNSERMFHKTMDWITTSKSIVATVVRNALPTNFSQAHFDSDNCLNVTAV